MDWATSRKECPLHNGSRHVLFVFFLSVISGATFTFGGMEKRQDKKKKKTENIQMNKLTVGHSRFVDVD